MAIEAVDVRAVRDAAEGARRQGRRAPEVSLTSTHKRLKIEELDSVAARPDLLGRPEEGAGAAARQEAARAGRRQLRRASSARCPTPRSCSTSPRRPSDEASAKEAAGAGRPRSRKALDDMEFKRMLSGELDGGGAIVQITAGAGGVDASRLGADADAHADPLLRAQGLEGRGRSRRRRPRRPASRARRSPSPATTPTACSRPRTASTAWSACRRSTRTAAARPRSPRSRSPPTSTTTSRSTSTMAISGSTPTARAAPVASTSTRPTRRCASPTSRPASSCSARTSAASTRTRTRAFKLLRAKLYDYELAKREAKAARGRQGPAQDRVGLADPQLRAVPVPAGQRSPHRAQDLATSTASSTATSTS